MRKRHLRITALLSAVLLLGSLLMAMPFTASAADTVVYLGDREDLFVGRDSLDGLGMNTAHSGEALTIGSATFDKGVGFHCQPDRDAYVEFDISSLGLNHFAASVGVLMYANYFMEWGSISFHVYGDGELLASSPVLNWGDEPYFLTCSVEGVSSLKLVQNNAGGHSCDAGIWGDARVTAEKPAEPVTEPVETEFDRNHTTDPHPAEALEGDYTYVSDLHWLDTVTYPGNSDGRDSNTCNEMIFSADGTYFPKGVGLHATSGDYTAFVEVNIDGLGYTRFAAYYGVCETLSAHDISMATVKLAVFGDGELLFESETMTYGEPMKAMDCDITGVKTLRLAVAGAPGIAGAWATWGGAVLSRSGEITDDMLFQAEDMFQETESVTTDASTEAPTEASTEPATEAPTAPVVESTTEAPTAPVTDTPAEAVTSTEAPAESETDATARGCSSALIGGAVLSATAAAALVLAKKQKED